MIRLFPERGGWLEVVCGPMFSGKSEELIRRLRRAEIAGQRALIVKPRIDDRYDIGHVVSHAGAKMRAVAVSRPEEIVGLADGYDAVGIDEVQFFAPEIVDVIERLIERRRARRRRRPRPGLPRPSVRRACPSSSAAPSSSTSCRPSATAAAGPATMTQRLVDGRPAPADGETIVVGALEQYEARCRTCHELADAAAMPAASSASAR